MRQKAPVKSLFIVYKRLRKQRAIDNPSLQTIACVTRKEKKKKERTKKQFKQQAMAPKGLLKPRQRLSKDRFPEYFEKLTAQTYDHASRGSNIGTSVIFEQLLSQSTSSFLKADGFLPYIPTEYGQLLGIQPGPW